MPSLVSGRCMTPRGPSTSCVWAPALCFATTSSMAACQSDRSGCGNGLIAADMASPNPLHRHDRPKEIDESRTLKRGGALQVGCRPDENILHAFGLSPELTVRRQKRRDGARHVRRGHAGAASFFIGVRLRIEPEGARNELLAGRDQVG